MTEFNLKRKKTTGIMLTGNDCVVNILLELSSSLLIENQILHSISGLSQEIFLLTS